MSNYFLKVFPELLFIFILDLAILVTGGDGDSASKRSIEIHNSDGTFRCVKFNSLLEDTARHTQTSYDYTDSSNNLKYQVCGGYSTRARSICQTYNNGIIQSSPSLAYERTAHVSWSSDEGLILMGGTHSPSTTGILTPTATESVPDFPLNYPLLGSVLISNLCKLPILYYLVLPQSVTKCDKV